MYKLIFEMPAFDHVSVYEYKKRADAVSHYMRLYQNTKSSIANYGITITLLNRRGKTIMHDVL